jgi:hypothetical protein
MSVLDVSQTANVIRMLKPKELVRIAVAIVAFPLCGALSSNLYDGQQRVALCSFPIPFLILRAVFSGPYSERAWFWAFGPSYGRFRGSWPHFLQCF